MVFQRPNPFPTMSVRDNAAAGLKLNGMWKTSELDDFVMRSLRQPDLWADLSGRTRRPRSSPSPTTGVPRTTSLGASDEGEDVEHMPEETRVGFHRDLEEIDQKVVHFFFQAEDGIRDVAVTGVQTCALPI